MSTTRTDRVYLTADEAKAVTTAASFTETDEDTGARPRQRLHSFVLAGPVMIGADWDLTDVHAFIDRAADGPDDCPLIAWVPGIYPLHDLIVVSDANGRHEQFAFEVTAPDNVRARITA